MMITETRLGGLLLIDPPVFEDERGSFSIPWNAADFATAAPGVAFVQDNHSRSEPYVLRGLHYQNPRPQGKLVRVVAGSIFDVVVDLRRSSSTFGQWAGFEISASNRRMLWAPAGFAHGFLALEDGADVAYKVTAPYSPDHERVLGWDDPGLAIDWPLPAGVRPRLSPRDGLGDRFCDVRAFP